jgi:hypothetical protein
MGPLPPVPPACPKVFRLPAFVRHFNFSVVPKRCGHIDMEPLLPLELSNQDVSNYLQITLDALGPVTLGGTGYLSPGECGKVYDNHDRLWQSGTIRCEERHSPGHSAQNVTKRDNPPSLPTPWVNPGGGEVNHVIAYECLATCKCTLQPTAFGGAARTEAPPCLDSTLTGICKVCGQAFHDKMAKSLVQLWCDPTDQNCQTAAA